MDTGNDSWSNYGCFKKISFCFGLPKGCVLLIVAFISSSVKCFVNAAVGKLLGRCRATLFLQLMQLGLFDESLPALI